MHLLERLEHDIYKDGPEEIDPSTIAKYCAGVNGDVQSITETISKRQEPHVRHPPPLKLPVVNHPSNQPLSLRPLNRHYSKLRLGICIQRTLG